MANMNIRELSRDVYKGSVKKYSRAEGEAALKKYLLEAVGGEWNQKNFRKHRLDVYEVLENVLVLPLEGQYQDILNGVVDVETVGLGDKINWSVPSRKKFKVAKIAAGQQDIRRQRIEQDKKVEVATDWLAIKVYEEFENFISGRIDFVELINRVKYSFERHISKTITKTIVDSYSELTSGKFYVEGAVNKTDLRSLITRVEAKTGMPCGIYGSATALASVSDAVVSNASDKMKDEYGKVGFFGNFEKTPMIELVQSLDDEDEFEIPEDMLFVLPIGLKTIKVVFEGDPIVDDTSNGSVLARTDMQVEMLFAKKVGVGIVVSNYHGIYKIQ